MLKTDEKLLNGEIEADSYQRLKAKLVEERDRTARLSETPQAGEAGVLPDFLYDVIAACNLAEAFPRVWAGAEAEHDERALHDLAGSIAPDKLTFEGGSVRTLGDWGLFGPEAPKTKDADSSCEPAFSVVAGGGFEPPIFGL